MFSPEQQNRISQIRALNASGKASIDDFKEFILILRESRRGAAVASTASKSRAKAPVNVDQLFDDIDKLLT